MVDVLAYIENTNRASSEYEAFSYLEKELSNLGLDRVIYSLMTDHDTIGKKAGHGVLLNYPDDWMSYYNEKDYEGVDPVRKYIMQSNGAFLWQDLKQLKPDINDNEQLLMNEANEAGLQDGVGFALHAPNNEVLGMGFASSAGKVELNQDLLSLVSMLATQFHNVFRRMYEKKNKEYVSFTSREKGVVYWSYKGKSNWEIGQIIGVSEHTVKFHLSKVFNKLNVNNKISAVLKSISIGAITP